MKAFTAVQALLAVIAVLITLWHGADGVVQISSPGRAQRSILYHSRDPRDYMAGNARRVQRRQTQVVGAVLQEITDLDFGTAATPDTVKNVQDTMASGMGKAGAGGVSGTAENTADRVKDTISNVGKEEAKPGSDGQ